MSNEFLKSEKKKFLLFSSSGLSKIPCGYSAFYPF